eukprot:CAMPEP_0171113906 /NCGR_PEP_ID=MMETSP0766_2-20121228/83946_1 /TAXON_ID=439317 /ORGANISM="Gambierdiscus australes, Strain CAWD 149" /LENGTH=61 /DNA_ID=CAMNT_0011576157 /DNA_START=1 /DNA_END=186 /DNA_ORIENTATION=-
MKSQRNGEDFEFTEDSLPPPSAAKLRESKAVSHPHNNRDSAKLHDSKRFSHSDSPKELATP